MKFLKELFNIFYPKTCVCCEKILIKNEHLICTYCRHDLPLAHFFNFKNNKITQLFYGRIPIEKANALLIFRKKGITKKLLHELKYKGNEEIGTFFGNWLGTNLKLSKAFSEIDYIVPIPLHPKKQKERGYNQVTKFGKKLSHHLNKTFLEEVLIRVSTSKTQTFKNRFERFKNVNTMFQLKNISIVKNKHILLIDDVITTGATLEACAKKLLQIKGVKISILTIAYTE